MKKKDFTAIGIMTGTSMDGVDLSLIKSDGYDTFTTILNKFFKFDQKLLNNLINWTIHFHLYIDKRNLCL